MQIEGNFAAPWKKIGDKWLDLTNDLFIWRSYPKLMALNSIKKGMR